MAEVQTQPTQQPKSTVSSNLFFSSKSAIVLVSIWLLLILVAAFYFSGLFRFINVAPQETSEASYYLSINRLNFTYLAVVGVINGLLVFLGLKWVRFARVFFHYIDSILIVLGILGLIAGYSLPCEGLSCTANGFLIIGGASVLGSVFAHVPLFYLILNGANRTAIGAITALFVLLMILVPYTTYTYSAKTLPKKAEVGISQAQEELGITILKPTYLPNKTITKQFEGVRANSGEYYLDYYFKTDDELDIDLNIRESKPQGGLEELLKYGGRSITINNNPAAVSTSEAIQQDSRFETSIVWVSNGTEINLQYGFEKGTQESVEAKAVKIAESMEPT